MIRGFLAAAGNGYHGMDAAASVYPALKFSDRPRRIIAI
jgi:hypothetical protein